MDCGAVDQGRSPGLEILEAGSARLPRPSIFIGYALFLAQGGLCFHCGKAMANVSHGRGLPDTNLGYTREHVVPHTRGGRSFRNIVLSHHWCNHWRGHRAATADEVRRCGDIWNMMQLLGVRGPGRWKSKGSGKRRARVARERAMAAQPRMTAKLKELLDGTEAV